MRKSVPGGGQETMNHMTMNVHTAARRTLVIPVLSEQTEQAMSVDGLFGQLQRTVASTRQAHPELTDYHLHDVGLRMEEGELRAVLDFRL